MEEEIENIVAEATAPAEQVEEEVVEEVVEEVEVEPEDLVMTREEYGLRLLEEAEQQTADAKAEMLHSLVKLKLDETCPEKVTKVASDDQPWFTDKLKRLDRKK